MLCLSLPSLLTNNNAHIGLTAGFIAIDTIFNFKPSIEWLQYSISGIGNIVSLFVILSVFITSKTVMKVTAILFVIYAFVSLSYIMQYGLINLGSGYYLWVLSLFVIAYAHYCAYKKPNKAINNDAQ